MKFIRLLFLASVIWLLILGKFIWIPFLCLFFLVFSHVCLIFANKRRVEEFLLFKRQICKYINNTEFAEWVFASNKLFNLTPMEMFNLYQEQDILEQTKNLTKIKLYDTLFSWN